MQTASDNILNALIKRRTYSQVTLTKKLGKSQSHISRIEKGKKQITSDELENFSVVLETPMETYQSLVKTHSFLEYASKYHPPDISIEQNNVSLAKKSKETLFQIIKKYFHQKAIKSVYIFGSVARNEHTENSDLDIMVAFKENYKAALFDLITFKQDLIKLTGYKVDIVQEGAAYPNIQKRMEDKIAVQCPL